MIRARYLVGMSAQPVLGALLRRPDFAPFRRSCAHGSYIISSMLLLSQGRRQDSTLSGCLPHELKSRILHPQEETLQFSRSLRSSPLDALILNLGSEQDVF